MNLTKKINGYKYNSLVKVIIGKSEQVGLIIQHELLGPVYFYSCNIYGVYTKYRVLPPESNSAGETYELTELIKIRDTDHDSHHYKWLHDNCSYLKKTSCLDMRQYSDNFAKLLNNNTE